MLREVAHRVFDIDLNLTITGRTQRSVQLQMGGDRIEEHVIFLIKIVRLLPFNLLLMETFQIGDGRRDSVTDSQSTITGAFGTHFKDPRVNVLFRRRNENELL